MGRQLSAQELDELLGAYALDAIDDPDERQQIAEWVVRSPAAAAELASLRETAALLAHAGGDAPDGVWTRIEEALSVEPPKLTLPGGSVVAIKRARRKRRTSLRIGAGVAAASVAAALITAVIVNDRMSDQEDRLAELSAAVAAAVSPNAQMVRLTSDEGASATVIAMPNGDGYFMASHLPSLPDGRAYQLWALTGDPDDPEMVSAGVLGRSVHLAEFHGPRKPAGFTVTEEDEDGADHPSENTVLTGHMA